MNNNNNNGGIGCGSLFIVLLQIVFIVLRLCGVIAWGWAIVLLPLEIWAGLLITILAIHFIIYMVNSRG